MLTHLLITGYSILIGAILANLFANYLNICTWYKFLEDIFTDGLYKTLIQQNTLSLCWLFFIYPTILSISYILVDKCYQFLTQSNV